MRQCDIDKAINDAETLALNLDMDVDILISRKDGDLSLEVTMRSKGRTRPD